MTEENIHISPRGGMLLISSPLLKDRNFRRTVILLLEKGTQGDFIGLILNRPLSVTMEEVCEMPGDAGKLHIYSGGPVDLQRMFWLHTSGSSADHAKEIIPGLYVGGDYEEIINDITSRGEMLDRNMHFYVGYSGWGDGQLEKEIEEGAWVTIPAILDPHTILGMNSDEMWYQIASRLGPEYRHWLMFPSDPALN